jgi:predicted permease
MPWRWHFRRARRDDDLADEIAHYVAEETDDNLARGMTQDAARAAALRKFGNRTAIREVVYDMNTISWLDMLTQDLRYGMRQLRLRPGFAIAAILSLALGIGANTAIFTLVDQLLLRLLPVDSPRALVRLRVDGSRPGGNWGDGRHTFPYPTYLALRDRNTVFSGVTGQRVESVNLLGHDGGTAIAVALVAGNYFQVLGVRSHVGRLLLPEDDQTLNGHPVAVLQYDFWRAQYHGRLDIVGDTIPLNGTPFTVVGIAAPGFEGTNVGVPTRVFVPLAMKPTVAPGLPGLDDERAAWFYPMARLKPGVTFEQAEAAMKVLHRQRVEEELGQSYFARFPESRASLREQKFSLEPGDRGDSSLGARFERPLIVLEWLAATVLLIACANIAGLLLARGVARRRDLAIRRAIGAGRGRIIAQLFAESALVAVAGAAAGLVVGTWLTDVLIALLPPGTTDISLSATPDLRILAFTIALTVLTSILFGLVPAWQSSQIAPVSALREESGSVAGGRTHARFRKLFVGLQVALSAVLLLGAGLFVRSLVNLQQVPLGLRPENVVTFVAGPAVPYDREQKRQAYRAVIEGLKDLPGVVSVGASRTAIFTGGRSDGVLNIAGRPDTADEAFTFFNAVSPGYFATLGIPVRAGKDFTWSDWGAGKRYALVNQSLTDAYLGGAPPMGRMFGSGTRSPIDVEIIGVVGDARYHDVRGAIPRQTFYNLDAWIHNLNRVCVYVRTTGNPHHVMASLRAAVRRIDSNFVVSGMRTLDEQINTRMANERMLSFLAGGFAVLATILALVGLHGVIVFQVAHRTREIGVRMALGARRGMIVRLIASEMVVVVLGGLAAGVATAYFCGRYVQSQLFGLDASDPLVFGAATFALLLAAGAATILPALRASRIDPLNALRQSG